MCYIQVKNIRLNSFYEEKKIKLCLTKQLLNMFKLWCEWGIRWEHIETSVPIYLRKSVFCYLLYQLAVNFVSQRFLMKRTGQRSETWSGFHSNGNESTTLNTLQSETLLTWSRAGSKMASVRSVVWRTRLDG